MPTHAFAETIDPSIPKKMRFSSKRSIGNATISSSKQDTASRSGTTMSFPSTSRSPVKVLSPMHRGQGAPDTSSVKSNLEFSDIFSNAGTSASPAKTSVSAPGDRDIQNESEIPAYRLRAALSTVVDERLVTPRMVQGVLRMVQERRTGAGSKLSDRASIEVHKLTNQMVKRTPSAAALAG